MDPSPLNSRITIQSRDSGEDAAGQPLQTWSNVATVWAHVLGQTGMGTIRHSGEVAASINAYSFRIRYRTDVVAGMRVVFGGVNYDIKPGGVRHDHAGKAWTDLVCEVGGNDG